MFYEAECKNCKWNTHSFFEAQVERLSEEHMMQSGHVVEVIES